MAGGGSLAAVCLQPGCSASAAWHLSQLQQRGREEQQGGVNPVLGHGGRGARTEKKTVTQEEGDTKSAYVCFPRVDLVFRRLLSGPSGFVWLTNH